MFTAKQASRVKAFVSRMPGHGLLHRYPGFRKGHEEFYEQVQKQGVRYRKGLPSEIYQRSGKLVVRAEDELLGEPYEEEADLVVLATGLTQRKDADCLRHLLKLSKGTDQFYLEVHPKLRPLDTATEGVFLAGTCQGPKDICDTISQAHGAASRATTPLFAGKVKIDPITAVVDAMFCAGCGLCEQVCEYRAIQLDPHRKVAVVNPVLCKGCGVCNATCPSSAIRSTTLQDGTDHRPDQRGRVRIRKRAKGIVQFMEKGLIQVYTGDGKGKTTAALGLALRAVWSWDESVGHQVDEREVSLR